jgi:hypothetical protein
MHNVIDALDLPSYVTNNVVDRFNFKLTVDSLITVFKEHSCLPDVAHIVNTPYLKKQLQLELDRCTAEYINPDNTARKTIKYGFKAFEQIILSINFVNKIWPECPLDHYRTYYDELRSIRLDYLRTDSQLIEWLRQHMSVASFFNILRKYNELDTGARMNSMSDYDYHLKSFYELNDTFSMIMRILEEGKTLEPPKRWRMPDFHDYVQAEAWKITNKKESLYQDLFPCLSRSTWVNKNGHSSNPLIRIS